MRVFYQAVSLGARDGAQQEEITALVDTGSIYTFVPAPVLERLGIEPRWSHVFELADGSEVEYGLAEILIRMNGEERTRICIFGPPNCEPLLGADTLEGFGLMADPVNLRLIPARMFLA